MKRVTLRVGQKHSSKDVFRTVLEHSPQRPLGIPEIRKRVRLLDALDVAVGNLVLEDADYIALKEALENFPWQVAHSELLTIIDDVLEAKPVSTANLKTVGDTGQDAAE